MSRDSEWFSPIVPLLTCRFCGCTTCNSVGQGGHFWVLPDVCSNCAAGECKKAGLYTAPAAVVDIELFALMAMGISQYVTVLQTFAGEAIPEEVRAGHLQAVQQTLNLYNRYAQVGMAPDQNDLVRILEALERRNP